MTELVIDPEQLLVGLSYSDRGSLCTLIALYEESYLQKLVLDMFKDAAAWMAGRIKNKLTGSDSSDEAVSLKKEERKRAFESRLARNLKNRVRQSFGLAVSTILVLKAIAERKRGTDPILKVFRHLPEHLPEKLLQSCREILAAEENAGPDVEARGSGFLKDTARRLASWARDSFVSDDYPNALDYLRRHQAIDAAEDKELMKKATARLRTVSRSLRRDSKLRDIDRQLAELAGTEDGMQTVREIPRREPTDSVSQEIPLGDFAGEDTQPDVVAVESTDPELASQTVIDHGASGQRASRQAREFTGDDQTTPEAIMPRDIDHRATSLRRVPLERLREPEAEPDAPSDRRLTVQGKPPLDEQERRLAGLDDDGEDY